MKELPEGFSLKMLILKNAIDKVETELRYLADEIRVNGPQIKNISLQIELKDGTYATYNI